jgi:hypothetical protein
MREVLNMRDAELDVCLAILGALVVYDNELNLLPEPIALVPGLREIINNILEATVLQMLHFKSDQRAGDGLSDLRLVLEGGAEVS